MNPPVITLLTDFGTVDGFVGAMKGVILGILPGATVVDLTHDIPAQDVRAGAWALREAAPHFPPGTVHVAVVDGSPLLPTGATPIVSTAIRPRSARLRRIRVESQTPARQIGACRGGSGAVKTAGDPGGIP